MITKWAMCDHQMGHVLASSHAPALMIALGRSLSTSNDFALCSTGWCPDSLLFFRTFHLDHHCTIQSLIILGKYIIDLECLLVYDPSLT